MFTLRLAILYAQDAMRERKAARQARRGVPKAIAALERHLRLCAEFPGAPGCA